MTAMALVFAVIYPKTIARVGYEYNKTILVPSEENGSTLYSGKIKGKAAQFTVTEDKTVTFRHGDKTYGPYTVREDASAVPQDRETSGSMTGIEVREGDAILFRGGVMDLGDFYWLYSEDGTTDSMVEFSYSTGDGIERDANGDPIDRMKPSVSVIYELTQGPELTHKGFAFGWFGGVLLCILNALSMFFADELFRMHLAFRVRDPQYAEPSDWEISGRYIGWTVMTAMALAVFLMGLQ